MKKKTEETVTEDFKKEEEKQENKVIFTATQQRISALASAADDKFPDIKITDYIKRIEMEIPSIVKKPEYAYRWIYEGNLDKELVKMGGIFEIVTRNNHSHVPSKLFGITGAISYKGENILCFTSRSIAKNIEKYKTDEFNKKTERAMDTTHNYGGGKIVIERTEAGESAGSELMNENEHYDAKSPE